jgi:hypothetical protein
MLGSGLTLWIVIQICLFYKRIEARVEKVIEQNERAGELNIRASELNERTAQLDAERLERIIRLEGKSWSFK